MSPRKKQLENYQDALPEAKKRQETPKVQGQTTSPDVLQQSLVQLNSSEWEMTLQGLQGLKAHIHAISVTLARHIKNLRSQVARSACRTASDLFSFCKKGLDMQYFYELVNELPFFAGITRKYPVPSSNEQQTPINSLRADANAALDIMSESISAHSVIVIVTSRGITHPTAS
ncbi:hypothetical protein NQ317_003657 [Molorchus minor]|uniref:Uncharacterized protein n=1 Tax=Molorchus minor TaxID=1323400 RepID=A0ABQ9IYS0_9CUCU|nr:hypothetical protein NQ317_003657 [Molorchus minor]